MKRRTSRPISHRRSQKAVFDMLEARTLFSAPAVIGYLTDETSSAMLSNNKVDWTALTHVNYFSFFPQDFSMAPASYSPPQFSTGWNGGVFATSKLDDAVTAAHSHSKKINLVIGGWGYGDPISTIANNPTQASNFVTNVVSFANAHNVDGIDLDWEPSSITHNDVTAYGDLIAALDAATTKELSVAVNPELNITVSGQKEYVIPKTAIAHLNYVNVMDYDLADIPGNPIGSPLAQSITDMGNWKTYGVPAAKLIFGVPFYGLSSTNWGVTASYQALADAQGTFDPARDQLTMGGTTYNFNGPNTIHAKAQWAAANAGGVMIWQLSTDHFTNNALDSKSLLSIIKADVLGNTNTGFATLDSGVLTAAGTSSDDVFTLGVNGSNIVIQRGAQSQSFAMSSVNKIYINGDAGDDSLEFYGPMTNLITFNGGSGYDTLNVNAGTYTFFADAHAGNDALYVSVAPGATVNFSASQHIDGLNVLGTATLSAGASKALWTNGLTINSSGKLDLNNNDLIVAGGSKSTIEGYVRTAYNGGAWNGASGIFSTTAKNNASFTTTLGVESGAEFNTLNGGTFNGATPAASDVLVKYTYYGDVNFDGTVDGLDYIFADNGFLSHQTGWANGDANYDGAVDGLDYIFIDNAFLTGGPTL